MSVQQMETWKNFAMAIVPAVIMLVTAILIVRKQRNGITIAMVAAAAAVILLPVISQFIVHNLLSLAAEMNAMPAAQQQDAINKYKPYVDKCNYYRSLLGQATYFGNLLFAVVLLLWAKPVLAGMSGTALPGVPRNTEDKAPDAS